METEEAAALFILLFAPVNDVDGKGAPMNEVAMPLKCWGATNAQESEPANEAPEKLIDNVSNESNWVRDRGWFKVEDGIWGLLVKLNIYNLIAVEW